MKPEALGAREDIEERLEEVHLAEAEEKLTKPKVESKESQEKECYRIIAELEGKGVPRILFTDHREYYGDEYPRFSLPELLKIIQTIKDFDPVSKEQKEE